MADTPPAPTTGSFTQRLNRLHALKHPPGRPRPSLGDIAAAIYETSGTKISESYLHSLLSGGQDNPTRKVISALARYYGVRPAYFLEADDDQADYTEAQLALALALQNSDVRSIAFRAADLSAESLRTIAELVNRVRELEGLSDIEDPPAAT